MKIGPAYYTLSQDIVSTLASPPVLKNCHGWPLRGYIWHPTSAMPREKALAKASTVVDIA